MDKLIALICLLSVTTSSARQRHVALEWNTSARCLNDNFHSAGTGWYVSPWFSAYYQTEDWWIYHCTKGWMYPESDGNQGVWLFRPEKTSWIWTREDVYPLAYNTFTQEWFNFCTKPILVQ
jgi:hypothetical protein